MFYFTELLGLPVVARDGQVLGRLRELVVEPAIDRNLIQFLVYRHNGNLWQLPVEIAALDLNAVRIAHTKAEPVPVQTNAGHLLLSRDVLDQQIIDANGRKVVRVNDIGLELQRREGHSELRALQVEIGISGALRRLLQGVAPRVHLRRLSHWVRPRTIPWQTFDLVETDPARRMKLQITYDALGRLHPADAADIIEELAPSERGAVFGSLDNEVAADILGEVSPRMQRSLIEGLEPEQAADIVEEMEPDEAADVLTQLPEANAEEILQDMQAEERDEVTDLLEYRDDTAGGRMNTDFIALPESATAREAIAALRSYDGEVETVTTVFVLDARHELTGAVPLARLLLAPAAQELRGLANETISVGRDEPEREVAEFFDKYNLLALPVVDDQKHMLGVITVDDVIAWLRGKS